MLEQKKTETLYRVLDQTTQILSEALDASYLDSLIEICEDLIQANIQVENNQPAPDVVERLTVLLNGLNLTEYDAEEIRKAVSLAYLRAIQVDHIQVVHHQTPDAIAMIVAYVAAKFAYKTKSVDILDPFVGMGNLLATVVNYFKTMEITVGQVSGVEIDDALLALAGISFDAQRLMVNLIEGDSQKLELPQADIVVADVPLVHKEVDFVPDNDLIYTASEALNENGIGIFVVPSVMLENDTTANFLSKLTQSVYVQGIIKFAPSTFKNIQAAKTLLVVQRHGRQAKQAEQVLLAQVPTLTATKELTQFFADLDQWMAML